MKFKMKLKQECKSEKGDGRRDWVTKRGVPLGIRGVGIVMVSRDHFQSISFSQLTLAAEALPMFLFFSEI